MSEIQGRLRPGADVPPAALSAGARLRQYRQRLGLSLRDVHKRSATIATGEHRQLFYLSAARLAQIEAGTSAPGIYKLFSLSAIYGVDYLDLLAAYGIQVDSAYRYHTELDADATHLVASVAHSPQTNVAFPVKLHSKFDPETAQLINRIVAEWGEIPATFLQACNPRRFIYGYIGRADLMMYPLLRPGALVMIDGGSRRISNDERSDEFEHPIYFIELREGYRCAWCRLEGGEMILVPHPKSPARVERYPFPAEAEIVGQVVGVAMRLVPA
jgi:transcriptional regulator with XRE-family HTH domain